MNMQEMATDFLENVRAFNIAMDGPSGDEEIDAACRMRDSAISLLREFAAGEGPLAMALAKFEHEEDTGG
jgi:hypothetical protein